MLPEHEIQKRQIDENTARFMCKVDLILLSFLLVLIAVATFLDKTPTNIFWTLLLILFGYFIHDRLQNILKS